MLTASPSTVILCIITSEINLEIFAVQTSLSPFWHFSILLDFHKTKQYYTLEEHPYTNTVKEGRVVYPFYFLKKIKEDN